MVNVKDKTCIYEGCKIIPIYNVEGERKALYCSQHKLEEMVNVKSNTCIHEGCKTRPVFNVEGERKALYCFKHKLEGMIDVNNKTCIYEGCKTQPVFNLEGHTKALYCSKHKLEGMIDVNNKTCIYEGCKTQPTYNLEGQTKALYCSRHKLIGMINVISKNCKSEWCSTRVQEKYDGYCLFCYMNLFPDKPVSRNYKTKEKDVVDRIKESFPDFTWVADKKVFDGCSRRRPDLLLDMGSHIIIVEVDENKHTDYDCSCENKRLMELSQDLQHRPIIFIRFNPDSYINSEGKSIKSCWKLNNLGVITISKSKQTEWEERIDKLKQQIKYWVDNPTDKTIEIIELFY